MPTIKSASFNQTSNWTFNNNLTFVNFSLWNETYCPIGMCIIKHFTKGSITPLKIFYSLSKSSPVFILVSKHE